MLMWRRFSPRIPNLKTGVAVAPLPKSRRIWAHLSCSGSRPQPGHHRWREKCLCFRPCSWLTGRSPGGGMRLTSRSRRPQPQPTCPCRSGQLDSGCHWNTAKEPVRGQADGLPLVPSSAHSPPQGRRPRFGRSRQAKN